MHGRRVAGETGGRGPWLALAGLSLALALPAGAWANDVQIQIGVGRKAGRVTLKGDPDGNHIRITQSGNTITIEGIGTTTIDGKKSKTLDITNVDGKGNALTRLKVDLSLGDDSADLGVKGGARDGLQLPQGRLDIRNLGGTDTYRLYDSNIGTLRDRTRPGDTLEVDESTTIGRRTSATPPRGRPDGAPVRRMPAGEKHHRSD